MDEQEGQADRVARPIGRPSKYDPAYCERVIDLGCEGKSRVEIAFDIGVGHATIQRWEAEYPEFRAAMVHAKECEQVWWERKGRSNLATQGFQASMWSRSMAARFPKDWREVSRQEQTGPDGGPVQQKVEHTGAVAEILGRIARLSARAAEAGDPGSAD